MEDNKKDKSFKEVIDNIVTAQAKLIASLMIFISYNELLEEYIAFKEKFEEYMDANDGDFDLERFKKYIEKNEIRNA